MSALAALNPIASTHHEKCDGTDYHKRLRAAAGDIGACVLGATEIYVGMTTEPADPTQFSGEEAAEELRRLAAQGALETHSTHALLAAAGHSVTGGATPSRPQNPGGLSSREVDVLRVAAKGLITKEIADKLFISPKTVDHHIQHIYDKIDASTRAAAALWAMENAVLQSAS